MSPYKFANPVPMRDGVKLATIIALPTSDGSFPVVLLRTPYNAQKMFQLIKALLPQFNLAWVLQDTRGRYDSGGDEFQPFAEREDTLDTLAWIREQNWCNGDIHIFGPSYLGFVGLQVLDDAQLQTIFAPVTFIKPEDGLVYRSGILHLHWALPWSIMTSARVQASLDNVDGTWPEAFREPLRGLVQRLGWPDHVWNLFLQRPDEPIWQQRTAVGTKPLEARVTLVAGWYDFMLRAVISTYDHLLQRGGILPDLIIGPWGHNGYLQSQTSIGEFEIGEKGKSNVVADFRDSLERAKTKAPQLIRAFILQANRWIDLTEWPPEICTAQLWYLSDKESLRKEPPNNIDREFVIAINPQDSVPTIGGAVWEFADPVQPGPKDQQPLADRPDILRFYTPPFQHTTVLLGPVDAHLWVKTEVPETHFTAKLVLVEEKGCHRILQDGIVCVLGPQKSYSPVQIDMLATGVEIKKGEKLGFEVSWSNFPKYALPPLTKPTTQRIGLSNKMPSHFSISIY